MAGVTDKAFRKIIQSKGAGLTYTEMVSSKALYYGDKKTEKLMNVDGEKRPIAIQIFGNEPDVMGEISKNVGKKCDIIDINMGCPVPKVVKNNEGSRLLLDLPLIDEITKEVVKNSKVPVTIKIRKGWDKEHIVAVEVAKIAEKNGVSAITVHGRTRDEFFSRRC
jgi:tRNA-dihydrouridine synthase B